MVHKVKKVRLLVFSGSKKGVPSDSGSDYDHGDE